MLRNEILHLARPRNPLADAKRRREERRMPDQTATSRSRGVGAEFMPSSAMLRLTR